MSPRATPRRLAAIALMIVCFARSGVCVEPPITSIAVSPNEQVLVTASQAGVVVHDLGELREQTRLATDVVNIHEVAFSPDSQWLAVAGDAG